MIFEKYLKTTLKILNKNQIIFINKINTIKDYYWKFVGYNDNFFILPTVFQL